MMFEIVTFFLIALAVLALSVATRRDYGRQDAVVLAVCLCASWLITKLIAHHGDVWATFSSDGNWAAARSVYPVVDAVIVSIAVALTADRTEAWKIGFVSTIVGKLAISALYAWAIYAGFDTEKTAGRAYQILQNAGYALEFAFLSWPGVASLAGRYRRSRPFDRARRAGGMPAHTRTFQ